MRPVSYAFTLLLFLPFLTSQAYAQWLWLQRGGGDGYYAFGQDFAPDSAGGGYATGYFGGQAQFGHHTLLSFGTQDAFVARYEPDGSVAWALSFGGASNTEAGTGVAVDAEGAVYVAGRFSGTAIFGAFTLTSVASSDMFLAKLDPEGNVVWVRQATGGFSEQRVFVTPEQHVLTVGDDGAATRLLTYDADGSVLRERSSPFYPHPLFDAALASDGALYMLRGSSGPTPGPGDEEVHLARINVATGAVAWQADLSDVFPYAFLAGTTVGHHRLTAGGGGNVYVLGPPNGDPLEQEFMREYDPGGALVRSYVAGIVELDNSNLLVSGGDAVLGAGGELYVTFPYRHDLAIAGSPLPVEAPGVALVTYAAGGQLERVEAWYRDGWLGAELERGEGESFFLAGSFGGNLELGGFNTYSLYPNVVAKHDPQPTSTGAGPTDPAFALRLHPNPTRGVATLALTVPTPQMVTVEAFSVLGRRVYHGAHATSGATSILLDGRAWRSGVYTVRVTLADGTEASARLVRL